MPLSRRRGGCDNIRHMLSQLNAMLAHQGGWDEALLVIGPLVVIGGFLVAANRRASRALDRLGQTNPSPEGDSGGSADRAPAPDPKHGRAADLDS